MTSPLSPEQIRYIVEWWESGNEPRRLEDVPGEVQECCVVDRWGSLAPVTIYLCARGITIARLARALGEACEVVEDMATEARHPDLAQSATRALNQTRRELLGE